MSEQKSQDSIAQLVAQAHLSSSPQQQVVKLDDQDRKFIRSSEHTFENLVISSKNPSKIHQQANERELESSDEKHSFEEDVQSCWSDSVTSSCDHNISSPTNYSSNLVANSNNIVDATRDRKFSNKVRSSSNGRSSRCNTNSTGGRNVRKRVMANERERERTKSLNQALENLRDRLPVSEAEKRSKIQCLRIARDYIEFLGIYTRSSSQPLPQHQTTTTTDLSNPTRTECTQSVQYNQQFSNSKVHQLNTNGGQLGVTQGYQPDSPLTYKFYKFRLKSQNKNEA